MSDRIEETLNYLKVPDSKKNFYLKEFKEKEIDDNFINNKLLSSANDELKSILQDVLHVKYVKSFLEIFQRMTVQPVDLKNCKLICSGNFNVENNAPSSSLSVSQQQNIQHDESLAIGESHGQKRQRLSPSAKRTRSSTTTTTTTTTSIAVPPLYDYTKWSSVSGLINPQIQPEDFILIQKILKPHSISSLPENPQQIIFSIFPHLTPYLLQQIKMWGPQVISASQLHSAFLKNSCSSVIARKRTSQGRPSLATNVNVRRIDFLNFLSSKLHPIVTQDVFRILSLFPVALPLVIPSMKKDSDGGGGGSSSSNDDDNNNYNYKILIPLLRNCTIRWTKDNQTVENYLFSSPFKMIGALRVGSVKNAEVVGKSSFLNELLKNKYIFSSKKEPGSTFAPPLSLAGTIEFIPLTEETCESSFWELINGESDQDADEGQTHNVSDEVLLLANLHGDADDSRLEGQLNFLHSICLSLVLFCMPHSDGSSHEQESKKLITKLEQFGNEANSKIPRKKKQNTKVDNIFKLYVDPGNELSRKYEEISIFSSRFGDDENSQVVRDVFKRAIDSASKKRKTDLKLKVLNYGKLKNVEEIETEESRILASKIQALSNDQVYELIQIQNGTDSAEAHRLVNIANKMKSLGPELRDRKKNRDQILYHFLQILNQSSTDRQISMEHLDSFLSRPSSSSSNSNSSGGGHHQLTITMVYFFRELMTIYENLMKTSLFQRGRPFNSEYLSYVPKKVAELLLQGQCIELYNADKGIEKMSRSWLDNVLHHICHRHPNLRVFVVSILGIQSTGKSTLLNALFGCKFAVSAGSCTRGLFMKLLFLEEKYAEEQGFDAVLIIDTEGLCSPEKANDARAAEHDRKMSTFAVAVSNLTLININGEASLPILNILQIVIVTLGRLRKVGLEPSDLMVLQHSMEKK